MNQPAQLAMPLPMDALAAFCKKWRIVKLSVFGSILRDDFRPDSDVDFLAEFEEGGDSTFGERIDMLEELASIIGRKVDLVNLRNIEHSPNWIRRNEILSTAESIISAA